ncbi:MAG: ABC transporter substrate-binding protein [Treponema sp.]|nr:ABC transporter substrate-binding protein [Treponema sp.]
MKKIAILLTLMMVPMLMFSAARNEAPSASSSGTYLRLAWWGNTTRDSRTNEVVQLFMQKNPGVTVETEPTNWDGYWPKLATQAASGSLPDVMQQDYMYIGQWNDRNQLLDLTPYVQNGTIDLSQWADSAVASGRLGNKLIALNLGVNAWGMGVDLAALQQAGITIDDITWTWVDFERIAIEIFQKTGLQTMPPNEFHQIFEHIVRQTGASFFAADNKSLGWTNNSAAIQDNLNMWLRIKAAGALFDSEEGFLLGLAMEEEPISKGKTWNSYYWSNQHIGHLNAAKRPLDYLMFPNISTSKPPKYGAYLKPSQFISIVATTKTPDLAAKLVNFIINDLEANRILLAERGVPVPSDVLQDLSGRVDADTKNVFDYISKVTPYTSPIDPPDASSAGEVRDVIRPILLSCMKGDIGTAAAVTQFIQAANSVLSR